MPHTICSIWQKIRDACGLLMDKPYSVVTERSGSVKSRPRILRLW